MKWLVRSSLLVLLAVLMNAMSLSAPALAQDKSIVVASTTSTQDSGLFGYLLPIFKEKTGIEVKVLVAAGKAANLAGERPVPSIARSRTASISDARGGNKPRCART
jgi:ABC-type tungstate transport system permease subunit